MLTARDLELLHVLTSRVRVLSLAQLARTWWPTAADGEQQARRRLLTLAEQELLEVFSAVSHPELALEEPEAQWSPRQLRPDFGAVSYKLKRRWNQRPVLLRFAVASEKGRNMFGRHGGRRPREVELTHDLHLSAVYLRLRACDPAAAEHWVFEEKLRERRGSKREKLPDAMIDSPTTRRIVEFGGAYSKRKLETFHRYCTERSLPYEIW